MKPKVTNEKTENGQQDVGSTDCFAKSVGQIFLDVMIVDQLESKDDSVSIFGFDLGGFFGNFFRPKITQCTLRDGVHWAFKDFQAKDCYVCYE